MRTRLLRLFGAFLTAAAVYRSTGPTARAQQISNPDSHADQVDSDGDGLIVRSDPHPRIAEIQGVSWQIRPLKLGWKWDAALESVTTDLSAVEKSVLEKSSVSFGADAEGRADATIMVSGALSLNPIKMLRGTGAEAEFKSRFSVSGNANWNDSSQDRPSQIRRPIEQKRGAQSISGMNLEFTVDFFNRSEVAFVRENLQIPIKTADEDVANAQARPGNVNLMRPAFGAVCPQNRSDEIGLILPDVEMTPAALAQFVDSTLLSAAGTGRPLCSFDEIDGEDELFGLAERHRPRMRQR